MDERKKFENKLKAQERRRALREKAVAYKGGKCEICGYDRCIPALDLHHISDLSKEFNVSSRLTSWEDVKAEVDKCALLCARCHREVHDGLHPSFLDLHNFY